MSEDSKDSGAVPDKSVSKSVEADNGGTDKTAVSGTIISDSRRWKGDMTNEVANVKHTPGSFKSDSQNRRWRRDAGNEDTSASVKYTSSSREARNDCHEHSERTHSASRYERGDKIRDSGSGRRSSSRGNSWSSWKSGPSGNTKSSSRKEEPVPRRGFSKGHGSTTHYKGDDQGYQRSRPSNSSSSLNLNARNVGSTNESERRFFKDNAKESSRAQSEDPLFKLLKRIVRPNIEREKRVASAKQLKEILMDRESNIIYTSSKVFELIDSLQNILFERGVKDVKQEVAMCIGLLGSHLDADDHRFLDWIYSNTNSSDEEIKIYACLSLLELLKQDSSVQKSANFMEGVLANMQSMLGAASSPHLLSTIMDVILVIAQVYPHIFSSCFREVIDIVIGWLIDPLQGEFLQDCMSRFLVSLQPFWTSEMDFSAILLGQFTEDLEIMLEQDLNQALQRGSEVAIKAVTDKITALLRVFYLVMLSLGETVSCHKGGSVSLDYLGQLLTKLVAGLTPVVHEGLADLIVILSNDSVRLLLHQLNPENATGYGDTILHYLMGQIVGKTQLPSNSAAVSLIRLLQKVVELWSTHLPVDFLHHLMRPESLLISLRSSTCPQVMTELMTFYHNVMALKSVPLLEEAYRLVLGDLEMSFNVLLDGSGQPRLQLVAGENAFASMMYSPRQAQSVICFNIGALTEIANTKSNLIGMWALSPSIFTLLSQYLMITSPWLNNHYPSVVYAILYAFHSHCHRHSNFMSSSNLVTPVDQMGGSRLAGLSQATSHNFTHILVTIHQLLDLTNTGFDNRCLLMKWCADILSSLATSSHVYSAPEVIDLLTSLISQGYHREQQILQCCAQCLKIAFKTSTQFTDVIMKKTSDLCLYRLTDGRKSVREAFMSVLKVLPLDFIMKMSVFEAQEEWMFTENKGKPLGLSTAWHARRNHMVHLPAGTFHSHNFRHTMAFILNGTNPSQTGSFHWLEAMFHTRQRTNKSQSGPNGGFSLADVIDNNESLLWFWATWECAQFAVISRLRTPLGKAPETFMAIETVIKSFAAEAQAFDQPDDDSTGRESGKGEKPGEFTSLNRVRLLLNFMEHLDKLLYNAYEGCSVAMPGAHKVVKTFFRTNRNTCQEWLARIRMPLLTIAVHCGKPAIAVRQAFELLRDLDEAGNTEGRVFDQAIMYLIKALCQLNSPESIIGVYHWCKEITGKSMDWILAVAEMAYQRYERAARELQKFVMGAVSAQGGTADSGDSADESIYSSDDSDEEGDGVEDREKSLKSKLKGHMTRQKKDELNISTPTMEFLSHQVCESYMQLNDWEAVLKWQSWMSQQHPVLSDGRVTGNLKPYIDNNYMRALQNFDMENTKEVKQSLELIPGLGGTSGLRSEVIGACWDFAKAAEVCQRSVLQGATQLLEDGESTLKVDLMRLLQQSERQGEGLVKMTSSDWPPVINPNLLADLSSLMASKKHVDGTFSMIPLRSSLTSGQNASIDVYHQLMRTVRTIKKLQGSASINDFDTQLSCLRLSTANLSRKHNNLTLAEHLLLEEASVCLDTSGSRPASLSSALTDIRKVPEQTVHIVKLQREGSKHLRESGKIRNAMEALLGSVMTSSLNFHENARKSKDGSKCAELGARSLLNIVKWLQADPKFLASLAGATSASTSVNSGSSQVMSLLAQLFTAEKNSISQGRSPLLMTGRGLWDSPNVPETDGILGTLLHLSAMQSPGLAKAWFNLASWCYKWGRKAVDNASNGYTELSEEEKAQILNILPPAMQEDEKEIVFSILSQVHNLESADEDIIDQDQSLYDDGTETTRKQLLSCSQTLAMQPLSSIERLLGIWRGVVKRLYHFYHLSAQAYFTYLQVKSSNENEDGESGTVVSTLRLLRLLVKHAWELREVLELGLSQTPTQPWKGIIPQLFSRLSHPESYVRHSISELLCRIGLQSPHLILYPAVVGSSNKLQIKLPGRKSFITRVSDPGDDGVDDQDDDDADDVDEGSSPELQACLSSLVESLSKRDSRMVWQVQLMVQELRRVTLLWEELWLGTLNQHQGDVQRRLVQLEAEVRRVEANKSLTRSTKSAVIKEKHRTIMKPTLMTVRHLYEITSQTPQTPQEKWFQSAYGQQINAALRRLEDPPDPANPHDSWSLFKNIQQSLQSRAQKRSSLQLKMEDISPGLSGLSHSVIPMPGQVMSDKVVTIEGVHDVAQILPTKTKPKKLIFIGSDGKRHPYLFKGLEDLHLDERIMQFLSIVNTMLYSPKRDKGKQPLYRARHYSVTPLGSRSGLIQWVQGSTPLFSLYKKWQHREAVAATLKASAQNTGTTSPVASIPRPSEVFYGKLNAALKEKGLEGVDNRKDWPLSVLRNVLEDLMDETPEDLLARELWCCSSSAGEWWHMTQVYARSTAVISVIGYIIGLGDRHLDNVLIDLGTGEVVHIDYNVCFEKGKGLRVPEKVPFRMTANIETALGLTGVEGTFRLAAEHVLKTMRKGREPLLTLLEAFVYDPLVDWTTGMDAGYTGAFYGGEMGAGSRTGAVGKMKMEKDMTTSMFSIRLTEMDAAWVANKTELSTSLPVLRDTVETWHKSCEAAEHKEKELEDIRVASICLQEALNNPQHSILSLSDRYWDYSLLQSTRSQVIGSVEEKMMEYSNWHKMHTMALEKLNGIDFNTLIAKVSTLPNMGLPSFASASAFLQGAGQSQVLVQCDELEAEMSSLLEQRRSVLHEIVTILHTYSSVIAQLGSEFAADNRMHKFMGWLGDLLTDFSLANCEKTLSVFSGVYNPDKESQMAKAQVVFSTENKLKSLITDTDSKLCKLHERRNQDTSDTALLEAQVEEATRNLHLFIYENKVEGEMSLICVIVSALYTLNKRYLLMEGAASGAGDRLMDLTSRDGDWFLDELCSMSANVNQFLNTLIAYTQACEHGRTKALRSCMKATDTVYITLQDLNMSFRSIIIPEAIKLLQAQDPQLLSILSELETMISGCSISLDEMIKKLEVYLRNAIMGIHKEGHSDLIAEVNRLQEEFTLLTQGDHDAASGQLAPGQMLLMGLNGLFTHLELEFSSLIEAWDVLDMPPTWAKVDTVRDAKALQQSSFNATTRQFLPAIFFVKRVQAFHMFFLLASQYVMSMQGEDGTTVYDDERLSKPIKRFVADFVRKQILGFPSQVLGYLLCVFLEFMGVNVTAEIELKDIGAECKVPLDSLCKKGMDICLAKGRFQHSHLSQVSMLTTTLDSAWRKLDLAKRLDSHVLLLENQLHRHRSQLSRLQWVHHDLYTQANRAPATMVEPMRAVVLANMKKVVQTLLANESEVGQCLERYGQMETNIGQRLRWAAGANPSLHIVINEFEGAITFRNTFIHEESQRVKEISNLSQAVLQMEVMRTQTSEANTADSAFLQLVKQCVGVCKMLENSKSCVSDVELNLLRLKPLNEGDKSDIKWIDEALMEVTKFIDDGEKESREARLGLITLQKDIQDVVRAIKSLLSSHHKLMSDIRSILKTMAKLEEQDEGEEVREDGVRAYLAHYKTFSEDITSVMKTVVADEVSKEEMEKSLVTLDEISSKVDHVYDSLSALAPSIIENAESATENEQAASGAGDSQTKNGPQKDRESPPLNSATWKGKKEKEKVSRDPKTGKAVQERNSYAVGVWRRVKMKLEGRDPDVNKRMPVSEQIDMIVKEAKNLDNLAVLYEGWTPWV